MKAIVYTTYGPPDVLLLKEIEKPTPKENEILVRIKATAVNSADWRLRKADPFGVRFYFGLMKPKLNILGGVLSGVIEEVGSNVTRYRVGDSVFGTSVKTFGAYAEFKCLPEDAIVALKPNTVSHQEAAVIPFGGTTALYFLRKANIIRGQNILINGASGAVGTSAIQLAKYFGASVTAVCSTTNLELVTSLGAENVIDYTKNDFTKNGKTYDIIFDTIGKISVSSVIPSLAKTGTLVLQGAGASQMAQAARFLLTRKRKIVFGVTREKVDDMLFLKQLLESGNLKPVIDRTYPFEQMVEAHAYVEKGHKKGNVSIIIS